MMNRTCWLACAFSVALAPAAHAQDPFRRAAITGGPFDRGKCTIEVVVDDVVEIEITGDTGRIRTLSGAPGEWRRFICSSPIPRGMANFRFIGVDGRGRQMLLRDPRQTGGTAIVRIEDSRSGREGYTFDLVWDGGFNGERRDYDRRDGDRHDGDRHDGDRHDGDRHREVFIVQCGSDDMRRHYCDADTHGGVRLVRQRSQAECRRDYTWGIDRRGIWVDRGCRADFEVVR